MAKVIERLQSNRLTVWVGASDTQVFPQLGRASSKRFRCRHFYINKNLTITSHSA